MTGSQDSYDRDGDTALRCVALPILGSDIDARLEPLLALWASPAFYPRIGPDCPVPHLLVVTNDASDDDLRRAEAMIQAHDGLAQCFSGVSAVTAGLSGYRDVYQRKPVGRGAAYGTRAGPNFLFFSAMQAAARFGGFTLQIEMDCLPVEAGWLGRVQKVIDRNSSAWVIGSHYAGIGELARDTQEHLNGNALYKTGSAAFQRFLARVWMPRLLEGALDRPNLAYDCWWALEKSKASAMDANASWDLVQTFDGFFHTDPFVVNLVSEAKDAQNYARTFLKFDHLGRRPVFLHGPAMNNVMTVLRDAPDMSIFDAIGRLEAPTDTSAPKAVAKYAGGLDGQSAGQSPAVPQDLLAWQNATRSSARRVLNRLLAEVALDPLNAEHVGLSDATLSPGLEAILNVLGDDDPAVKSFFRARRKALDRNSA